MPTRKCQSDSLGRTGFLRVGQTRDGLWAWPVSGATAEPSSPSLWNSLPSPNKEFYPHRCGAAGGTCSLVSTLCLVSGCASVCSGIRALDCRERENTSINAGDWAGAGSPCPGNECQAGCSSAGNPAPQGLQGARGLLSRSSLRQGLPIPGKPTIRNGRSKGKGSGN